MFELKKFHHESGKGIYALSKRCNPLSCKALADDMAKWLADANGSFTGEFSNAYAISHCQVAEEPLQLFVVAPQLVGGKDGRHTQRNFFFPAAAIFNAEILEAPEEVKAKVPNRVISKNPETGKDEMRVELMERTVTNKAYLKEACMSFSHRSEKSVERFLKIKVRYWYFWHGIPMRRTEWVEGLKAHIFQHELDHAAGKNIYFK